MTSAILRVNPVAKLAVSFLLGITLVLTLDWVSATVAIVLESILFFWAGVSWRTFWLRTLPVWTAAPLVALTIALYGRVSGHSYFEWYLVQVTSGSITLAIATALRVLAIGLPAVVLFITIDPTDLADGLAQLVRLPARFVLGSLAALRLVGLFIDDWRSLELARRARGVADRGRLRRFAGQVFALLVLSIRRGSKLATAMEARGFGASGQRTWAREASFGSREWVLVALGVAIAAAAISASVLTGHWNFIGS
ncbi:MAG: energy-coupling factor transport system permease protein [Actinomycetota bacterium]|jgi:energy-coupling factor transport system permease protein|nr:transporter [Glaciihabitans sp.]MDQ1542962.1 energy-coupling factor transport system permease protein [Actinomycetota bacterium]